MRETSNQMVLAKALYDNIAETPEEIAFSRGDILTVLERDTRGLEGWWLCMLRDKTGIAPGNRLRVLAGMYSPHDLTPTLQRRSHVVEDGGGVYQSPSGQGNIYNTPPSQGNGGGVDQTPPNQGDINWNRRSWLIESDKVVTPRRVGSVYVYDQPNKPAEDYDVPTSRYFAPGSKAPPTIPDDSMTYDIPVSSTGRTYDAPQVDGGDTYDVPRNLLGNSFESAPWSNRSSALSDASGGSSAISSSLSFHSLHVGSTPSSSERSSADLSTQDIYDIPPSAKIAVGTCGKVEPPGRQLRSGGSFDKPDVPRKKDVFKVLRKQSGTPDYLSQSTDIYDVPQSKQFGYDSSDYDVPKGDYETDELDVEVIYDSSRSVSKTGDLKTKTAIVDLPKKQNRTSRASSKGEDSVYDIPPQVMKDTTPMVDQSRSEAFSELVNRFSHCSDDAESTISVPYDELPLELDTALELLVKLQQYVQRSTTKLLGFVSATWRQKDDLESRLYDIKIASVAVKCCLQDFVEFGQGALANSARTADRKLIQKIVRQLEPLQASLQKLNKNMANLDAANWQLSTLVIEGSSSNIDDDLSEVVNISKDVPSTSRLMTSLIQGNSSLLFKSPQQSTRDSTGKPPSGSATSQSKPRRPPPPLKPKPRLSVSNQRNSCDEDEGVQKRPLPSPPAASASTTPVPPGQPSVSDSVYAVPRSLKEDEVTAPAIDDEDYENDSGEWLDEYDYVQLTSAAATAQQKKMEEHNANVIKGSNKDKQLLNQQRNAQNQYSPSPVQVKGAAPQPTNQSQPPLFLSPSSKNIFPSPQSANSPQSIPYKRTSNTPQREIPQCQPPQMVPQSQLSGSTYSSTVGGVLIDMPSSPEHRLSTPFMIRLERLKQETQTSPPQVPQVAPPVTLDENERQIVVFYASQIDDHLRQLVDAIGAFFQCVEYSQPPKVFISYSKFVVLAAHKLVYTGDSIARNIYTDDVQVKITTCANLLCDCLKETVTATKVAALHYPSIVRVQEMVDRVVDVSHAGNELRLAIIQAAML